MSLDGLPPYHRSAVMATAAKFPAPLRRLFFSSLVVICLPAAAVAECSCTPAEDAGADKSKALKLKYAAIAAILFSAAVGVLVPLLGRRWGPIRPEGDAFFTVKAFAAGVILATGMIHILPDAFDRLTSPCLPESPWRNFPFAGFTSMVAALGTLIIDTCATTYYQRVHFRKTPRVDEEDRGDGAAAAAAATAENGDQHAGHIHLHTHATHGHAHAAGPSPMHEEMSLPEHIRHRVISQVLELGIVVHSVIIGISVGTSMYPSTIRPLIVALCFHQFFEGIGLGGCIVQARFRARATFVMALLFSLTTPLGVAVGIAIASRYNENSKTALAVEGLLDAASAGILIYMALVDLLAADFMNPRMQQNGRLQATCYAALLLGAGLMSLIAKWA